LGKYLKANKTSKVRAKRRIAHKAVFDLKEALMATPRDQNNKKAANAPAKADKTDSINSIQFI